ncbi:hypothetical protein PG984_003256 [Apiospora sp. TS-2023a]
MQASTNYQALHHRKTPTTGGSTAPFVAISEQSDTALSSVDDEAPMYSQDEVASVKEERNVLTSGRRARSPWADWKWELLLLLLSILSFVATVITLYRLNNTSLDSWGFFLGLNTVVSILAAISRAALAFAVSSCVGQAKWNWYRQKQDSLYVFERFDQASRGPWGSVRLLGTIWLRHWSAFGAILIVILLAYEPFMQTIITQYGVLDVNPSNTQAMAGRCQRLDSGQVVFVGDGGQEIWDSGSGPITCSAFRDTKSQPGFDMSAAAYKGFQSISEKQRLEATVICATGNCTFDDFTSLGICSKCADITTHVTKQRASHSHLSYDNGTEFDNMCSGANHGFIAQDYNYTTFRVGNLTIANNDGTPNSGDCNTATYLATGSTKNISLSYTVANTSTTTTFVLFHGLRASNAYIQGTEAWQYSQPTAFECQLSFCVKLHSLMYKNGQVTERVLDSWSQPVLNSYRPLYCEFDLRTEDSPFSEFVTFGNRSDFQVSVPEVDGSKYGLPPNLKFNVSQAAVISMVDWFENEFGHGHKSVYPAVAQDTWIGIAEILYNNITAKTNGNGGDKDSYDVSPAFEAVATSMSSWMRDKQLTATATNTDDRSRHIGTMKRWTIHYGVRWPFLVLPLVLEVAGALYVCFTIWETKRLGLAAWKDSALATIVYGLDGEENRALLKEADLQGRGKMKRAAREMRVAMVGNSVVRVMRVPELEPDELLEDSSSLTS